MIQSNKKLLLLILVLYALITIMISCQNLSLKDDTNYIDVIFMPVIPDMPEYFKISKDDNIDHIVVRYSRMPTDSIIISDEDRVSDIISQINDLNLRKITRLAAYTGWSIMLHFNNRNEESVYTLSLRADGVVYNGYLYSNIPEIPLFDQLFEYFQ